MRILIIGQPGAGKTTLARRLAAQTGWPLLMLDQLWHGMDARTQNGPAFARRQRTFMAAHASWIIEGNYADTLPPRAAQATMVIWLRVPRVVALARILRRSLRFRRDPQTRPEMPANFVEHWDRDYRDFLRAVWRYDDGALALRLRTDQRLVVVRHARQKRALCALIANAQQKSVQK